MKYTITTTLLCLALALGAQSPDMDRMKRDIEIGENILASLLQEAIKAVEGDELPMGSIDITFYRDDLSKLGPSPRVATTEMPLDVTDKVVILVDDVLYTGRTVRAALDVIMDWGRPRAIQLAVLVDRGHRELPVAANVVGRVVVTSRREDVQVRIRPSDEEDGVWLGREAPDGS